MKQKPPMPVAERTIEVFLGSKHASKYVGSPALAAIPEMAFTRTKSLFYDLSSSEWTLNGKWEIQEDKIIARGGSNLEIKVSAKNVYLVATAPSPVRVNVLLNDAPIGQSKMLGSDIFKGGVTVQEARSYHVVAFPDFREDVLLSFSVPEDVALSVLQHES